MKRNILPLVSALTLIGTTAALRADVVFSNLDQPGSFSGFGPGISAGTLLTTGPHRVTLNTVTLEQALYNPANPPQHFQVRIYQAVFQPGNPSPTMNLVVELGNPVVDPTPTSMPGLTSFVVYSPASTITLEPSTTYAITAGEGIEGSVESTIVTTPSSSFVSADDWQLGGDLFGLDFGGGPFWSPTTGHLEFKVDATPVLNQAPDVSNAHASVATLWPANGKMVSFQIQGVSDPDGDPVAISITSIQQDEPLAGSTPDAFVNGSDTASVRATRAGKGNGRVYKVSFTATDGKPGGVASGVVYITVPHDQGHSEVLDDGPVTGYFNSTQP